MHASWVSFAFGGGHLARARVHCLFMSNFTVVSATSMPAILLLYLFLRKF